MKKSILLIVISTVLFTGIFAEQLTFTADVLKYKFKEGEKRTQCIGNAKIIQGSTTIKAQRITIYGENHSTAVCSGNVDVIDRESQVEIKGGRADYKKYPKYAKITKSPILYLNKDNVKVTAAIMERFFEEGRNEAQGNVVITKSNTICKSERATFYEDENKFTADGEPHVEIGKDIYFADSIIVLTEEDRIILKNNIQAIIYPGNSNKDNYTRLTQ